MELFRELIKHITKWNGTKRLPGTTELGDENLFCEALNEDFVIFRREYVKEFLFKDGYKVYLVNIEQIESIILATDHATFIIKFINAHTQGNRYRFFFTKRHHPAIALALGGIPYRVISLGR